jgi:hypothetical protein
MRVSHTDEVGILAVAALNFRRIPLVLFIPCQLASDHPIDIYTSTLRHFASLRVNGSRSPIDFGVTFGNHRIKIALALRTRRLRR